MTDNLRVWNALKTTDPKHTKPFTRGGGFKGTATKPIWQIMRMTEQFGPAGIGWGMGEPQFQTVAAGDEILVFCTTQLWYREATDDTKIATVYGVGGDKVLTKRQSGPFTNDEAFKASYTDALSNAMKQIGVGADVHMGLFDDNKYVQKAIKHFDTDAMAEEARKDGLTTETQSTYDVNKLKLAIDNGWKSVLKTQRGREEQVLDYIDIARNAEEVNAILRANEDCIKASERQDEINDAGVKLLQWFEDEARKAHAA